MEKLRFSVDGIRAVSALLLRPTQPRCMLALAHGAGAGMEHPFMEALAAELANFGIATLRYQFPYLEEHRGAPDRPPVLAATVAAAVRAASDAASGLPVFAGGKSMGGRMSSQAAADGLLPNITGLVFFGFPLHPPKQPATKRADHLQSVTAPMLFLQGTRDDLADLQLLQPICGKLALRATLHIIEGADHSFHVLKKFRRTDADVMRELAETTAAWTERIIGQSAE